MHIKKKMDRNPNHAGLIRSRLFGRMNHYSASSTVANTHVDFTPNLRDEKIRTLMVKAQYEAEQWKAEANKLRVKI